MIHDTQTNIDLIQAITDIFSYESYRKTKSNELPGTPGNFFCGSSSAAGVGPFAFWVIRPLPCSVVPVLARFAHGAEDELY